MNSKGFKNSKSETKVLLQSTELRRINLVLFWYFIHLTNIYWGPTAEDIKVDRSHCRNPQEK
jgi:hypothetical protein